MPSCQREGKVNISLSLSPPSLCSFFQGAIGRIWPLLFLLKRDLLKKQTFVTDLSFVRLSQLLHFFRDCNLSSAAKFQRYFPLGETIAIFTANRGRTVRGLCLQQIYQGWLHSNRLISDWPSVHWPLVIELNTLLYTRSCTAAYFHTRLDCIHEMRIQNMCDFYRFAYGVFSSYVKNYIFIFSNDFDNLCLSG